MKESRSTSISLRISNETLLIIDQASEINGKNRTDFMLDLARCEAERVLREQRLFRLDKTEWDELMNYLDKPEVENKNLKMLMKKKFTWLNNKK
jgi:uncharacterized protein (DUF1778 family)